MSEAAGRPATRTARPDEAEAVAQVINLAYEVEAFFVHGTRTSADEVRARMAQPHAGFLVLDAAPPDGGAAELLGAVYVEIRGTRGYFAMLSVRPDRQGDGLGRALVAAVEQHCQANRCDAVDIEVVDLRTELPPFYEALGYREKGTAPFIDAHKLKQDAHLLLMSKPLPPAARSHSFP